MKRTVQSNTAVAKKQKLVRNKILKDTPKHKIRKSQNTERSIKNLTETEQVKYEEMKTRYQVEVLDYKEIRVLDCMLRNGDKKILAQELGCSTSLLYWISTKPEVVRAFQKELKGIYDEMMDNTKAMYMKILEKSLNVLMKRMEEMERNVAIGYGWERTRDILAVVDKISNLIMEHDGTKKLNMELSGGMTNLNVNTLTKEIELQDSEFRKHMAGFLVKTKSSAPIETKF